MTNSQDRFLISRVEIYCQVYRDLNPQSEKPQCRGLTALCSYARCLSWQLCIEKQDDTLSANWKESSISRGYGWRWVNIRELYGQLARDTYYSINLVLTVVSSLVNYSIIIPIWACVAGADRSDWLYSLLRKSSCLSSCSVCVDGSTSIAGEYKSVPKSPAARESQLE